MTLDVVNDVYAALMSNKFINGSIVVSESCVEPTKGPKNCCLHLFSPQPTVTCFMQSSTN